MAEWSVTGATPEQRRAVADGLDDTRSWVDPNGYVLSERLWRARAADRAAIDTVLRRALAAGLSPLETARVLERYLTPEGMVSRTNRPVGQRFDRDGMAWVENLSGRGNYAARRLARTEMARAYGRATLESAARNPWTRGVKWNLNQRHDVDDPCDQNATADEHGLGPGVYPVDAFPRFPEHPHCLCFITKVAAPFEEVLATAREEVSANGAAFQRGLEAGLREEEAAPQSLMDGYERFKSGQIVDEEAFFEALWNSLKKPAMDQVFARAATVEDAAAMSKRLGVQQLDIQAKGQQALDTLNAVNEAFHALKRDGFELPSALRIVKTTKKGASVGSFRSTTRRSDTGEWQTVTEYMEFNAAYVTDPKTLQRFADSGWLGVPTPKGIVDHEVGHMLHEREFSRNNPNAGAFGFSSLSFGDVLGDRWHQFQYSTIRQEVSQYASTNVLEFVAEVFSGLRNGKQYSAEVMDVYYKVNGPRV